MPLSRYALNDLLARIEYGEDEGAIDRALQGIDLNQADAEGQLPINDMALEGRPKALAYLLRRGVDPHRPGTPYVVGPALAYALSSPHMKAGKKVEVVKILLAGGADPSARVGKFGTLLDYAIAKALHEANPPADYAPDSKRDCKRSLAAYLATIPLLIAAGGVMSEVSRKGWEELRKPGPTEPFDAKAARAMLVKPDRDAVAGLCERLGTAEAAGHPDWEALVRAAVDAGRSFREVSKEIYGKEVELLDDEGWLCQSWERYGVLDLVFELLATDAALGHPAWAGLVKHALERREAQDAADCCEDAVDELFDHPRAKAHPAFEELRRLAEETG